MDMSTVEQLYTKPVIANKKYDLSILKEAFVGILTDRQIKSFIDKMEAENLITKEGKTRSARYLKTDYFASLL